VVLPLDAKARSSDNLAESIATQEGHSVTPTAAGPLTGTATHQRSANAFAASQGWRGMTSSGGSLAFCGVAQTLDTWDKQDGCNGVPQFLSSNCKDHIMIVNDTLDLVSKLCCNCGLLAHRKFATHACMHCNSNRSAAQLLSSRTCLLSPHDRHFRSWTTRLHVHYTTPPPFEPHVMTATILHLPTAGG
jgi:hypothetical protein